MTLIAGLDFGTSSVKLAVMDTDGSVVARGHAPYDTLVGSAGEVEQRPEDWWHAAAEVLATSGFAERIDAIGLTGQMQDLIPVAGSASLRPAMLYSDTRAGKQHARLSLAVTDWEQRTGNHQDVSNVVAKIAWLAEHEPAALASAEHLLLSAPAYIAWRAGGIPACDLVTASATGLLDVQTNEWLRDAVAAAGADVERLPRLVGVVDGDEIVGAVNARTASEWGVREGVPLVLGMGDAGSTTDGLVGSEPGDAYLYLGTTGWLAAVTESAPGQPSPIHALVLPGWQTRLRIGAVQSAGSAARWARDTFLPGLDFAQVESAVADRVDVSDARPLCLPGFAGERTPVRDGAFRGAFVGVHDSTGPIDLYLAVLTGVAMGLRHAADEMGIRQQRIALVGGASSSPAWRRIIADVFEATIVTGEAEDPGCHSAARSAMSALGHERTPAPLLAARTSTTQTHPSSARAAYRPLLSAHRALYDVLTPTFHNLHRNSIER